MIFALLLALAAQGPSRDSDFQQGVDYRIEARLDDTSGVLRGRARLRYTNRSPAALDTLYFHQHLNGFRPNSAWARRELQFGIRRFQDLGPSEHAYERLSQATVNGRAVTPVYPGGTDSTVVALPLPTRLAPGATAVVLLDWDARLSTVPRRQGRRGRHHDFAHWYPRIAVFDRDGWQVQELLPQGEFFGEFANYDVTLELAEDQVVGATGVLGGRGDPLGLLGRAGPGRKTMHWHAQNVHHFAWSADPAYISERGEYNGVAVNVLFLPGDSAWANGIAVSRTIDALRQFESIFGKYVYPQITNVHRIEPGGTEFPMLIMNGSASAGLILHEVGHQWLHGILANNEWKEGWLDEGFVSFVTSWLAEAQQGPAVWQGALQTVIQLEQRRRTQPIATRAEDFVDFETYNFMTYTKAALVLRMLRDYVGEENARKALRDYYERHKLGHVSEADLKSAFERADGWKLDWFFQQWLHSTGTLDYSVGEVSTFQATNGQWRTRIEVHRAGENWMPVVLQVGTVSRKLESRERAQVVYIDTPTRPTEVVLDPLNALIDVDPGNNRKRL